MKTKIVVFTCLAVFLTVGIFYLTIKKETPTGRTIGYHYEITPEKVKQAVLARMEIDKNFQDMFPTFYKTKYADIQPLEYEGEKIGYLLDFGEEGYVVLSADQEITPIIAFSKNPFDYTSFYASPTDPDASPLYMFMRNDLLSRKRAVRENVIPEEKIRKNMEKWDTLIQKGLSIEKEMLGVDKRSYITSKAGKIIERIKKIGYAWADPNDPDVQYWPPQDETETGGWVQTEWKQSDPYNQFCPMDPNTGERSAVGCVATAVAQVFNYHKYIGNANFSTFRDPDKYSYTLENDITIRIDEDHREYDFKPFDELNPFLNDIRNEYERDNELDSDQNKAALSFAVACAFEMVFKSTDSGATIRPGPLFNKFGYLADGYQGRNEINENVYDIMADNMKDEGGNEPKPAVLGITGEGGAGHAVVVDGYNTKDEYHMNFGQADRNENIWYSLPPGPWTIDYVLLNIERNRFWGTIRGEVVLDLPEMEPEEDPIDISVENIIIKVQHRDNENIYRMVSPDVNGEYIIEVPPGRYDIACYRDRYHAAPEEAIEDILVEEGDTTIQDFQINISDFLGIYMDIIDESYGVFWADYNNDNYPDLFIANYGNNILYENDGDGAFNRIEEGRIVTDGGHSNWACWGDYDGDGFLDLFVANGDNGSLVPENNFLYHNNGDGTFTKVEEGEIVNDGGNSLSACWGDYDNDGYLDLFVANGRVGNVDENNFLYHNNGDETFSRMNENEVGVIVANGGNSQSACWGDYDNDNYLDLFVANIFGPNFLYHNNGNQTFTKIEEGDEEEAVVIDDNPSFDACWGDYNNDGYLDLFVANGTNIRLRYNFLFRNNGDRTFTKIEGDRVTGRRDYSYGAGMGDYDNDGWLDIFTACRNNPDLLYHNERNDNFNVVDSGDIVTHSNGASRAACWGDYNLNGYLDLGVAALNNNRLCRNLLNGNNWFKIRCRGRINRFGIGTKIRLTANISGEEVTQLREVHSEVTHFGLGDARATDMVRIEWPSGMHTSYSRCVARDGRGMLVNEPEPLLALGQDVVTDEDEPLPIELGFDDPNGAYGDSILHFNPRVWPHHGRLMRTNTPNRFNYVPDSNYGGEDSFTFFIQAVHPDFGNVYSANATVNITVNQLNHPPELDPIGNQAVAAGQELTINLTATDVDGDRLTYDIRGNIPFGSSLDREDGVFTWTPHHGQVGNWELTFSVTDGQVTDEETINIEVTPSPNNPPTIRVYGRSTVTEGDTWRVWVSCSDPDGDRLGCWVRYHRDISREDFTFRRFGNWLFLSWEPQPGQAGRWYWFKFYVTDGEFRRSRTKWVYVFPQNE